VGGCQESGRICRRAARSEELGGASSPAAAGSQQQVTSGKCALLREQQNTRPSQHSEPCKEGGEQGTGTNMCSIFSYNLAAVPSTKCLSVAAPTAVKTSGCLLAAHKTNRHPSIM